MTHLVHTTAVLGHLSDDSAASLGKVVAVICQLFEFDKQLALFAEEEDKSGIDHTDESEDILNKAEALVDSLELGYPIELYYVDIQPEGVKGRLRLEIPGTYWDFDAPLYFQ